MVYMIFLSRMRISKLWQNGIWLFPKNGIYWEAQIIFCTFAGNVYNSKMIIEVNGTNLLQFAVEKCNGIPTLWILENNIRAKRLYHRLGFRETGTV